MAVLCIGALLVAIAVLAMSFHELCDRLKDHDVYNWHMLGEPQGYSFVDLGKTCAVYSWILSRAYLSSDSELVKQEGERALGRALFVRTSLLSGAILLNVGFVLALMGY
ncbi:hypothetical protein [Agaribacterium haliotis]|uniref:hypothetical protein n=1 Tax=Agaribacterium haliotis TaxID=2013869 RepID=UPI000BB59082|nr:hypothetical protein [Agaribacterium haliotis]